MNSGFEKATGAYVMPLNLDAYLPPDYIQKAVMEMEAHPHLAGISGTEWKWIDGQFTQEVNPTSGPIYIRKWIQFRASKNKGEQDSFGIHGSYPLIRMKALNETYDILGYYYDPKFEHDWEDSDLWFRLNWLGWTMRHTPKLQAWHVKSASAEGKTRLLEKSQTHQRRVFRNRRYIIHKNLSPRLRRLTLLHRIGLELLFPVYLMLRHSKSLKPWRQAKKDYKDNVELIEKDHQKIMASRKVDDESLVQKFF